MQAIVAFVVFASMFALEVRAQEAPTANWCKGRAQSDCTPSVACSWRETITDGTSKTSCIYNAKAAKAIVAKSVAGN